MEIKLSLVLLPKLRTDTTEIAKKAQIHILFILITDVKVII